MKKLIVATNLFLFLIMCFIATGAKNKLIKSSDLDHAYVQGAEVKYQLTDEEGGNVLRYSNGTGVTRFHARIIVDYTAIDGRRDEFGRQIFRLKIERPDFLGGAFEKDAPWSSGREQGTFGGIEPGDLVH